MSEAGLQILPRIPLNASELQNQSCCFAIARGVVFCAVNTYTPGDVTIASQYLKCVVAFSLEHELLNGPFYIPHVGEIQLVGGIRINERFIRFGTVMHVG
jgi:hypothetical protein